MSHVVVFAGDYDVANKDGIRSTLRRLESSHDLVLDLTEVTFIDSTFIAELILLERVREAKNFSRVTIVAPAESVVRRLFDVVGIASMLTLVESYNGERVGHSNSVVEFATGDRLDPTSEIHADGIS